MPRHLRRAGAAGAVAVAAALLAACTAGPAPTPSATPPPPSGDGVLRIGTLFGTKGDGAALAAVQTAAVNAAVRDIAAAGGFGGIALEVYSRDAASETSFDELVARGADVIIGPPDMELAATLVPLAREAGVVLVTPSAIGARPADSAGVLLRTASSARAQGAALAAELGDGTIALVRDDSPASRELAADFGEGLTDIVLTDDVAATAARVATADPVVVVVATASAPLLSAVLDTGIAADRLWLTGSAVTRYDETAGALEGAHGIQANISTDPAFAAALHREDPAAGNARYAAEAYDAVVLVALAAVASGDDGGPSIAAALPAVAGGGVPCHGFGECADVRDDGQDIDYEGVSGGFAIDADGDRDATTLLRYRYDTDNRPQVEM